MSDSACFSGKTGVISRRDGNKIKPTVEQVSIGLTRSNADERGKGSAKGGLGVLMYEYVG